MDANNLPFSHLSRCDQLVIVDGVNGDDDDTDDDWLITALIHLGIHETSCNETEKKNEQTVRKSGIS